MDLNEMNENWQEEAPILAGMEKKNPYTVHEGYFAEMEAQLLSRIKISEFDNGNPLFTVPEAYFDILPDKILSVTKLEEYKETSNRGVFIVPENYFATLEDRIKAKIDPQEQQTTKPVVRRIFSSWATYAAAACITAVISFGLYFDNTSKEDIETQIAQLPSEEIVDYLQLYSDAGDAPVIIESLKDESDLSKIGSEVSQQEIEQYLELNL